MGVKTAFNVNGKMREVYVNFDVDRWETSVSVYHNGYFTSFNNISHDSVDVFMLLNHAFAFLENEKNIKEDFVYARERSNMTKQQFEALYIERPMLFRKYFFDERVFKNLPPDKVVLLFNAEFSIFNIASAYEYIKKYRWRDLTTYQRAEINRHVAMSNDFYNSLMPVDVVIDKFAKGDITLNAFMMMAKRYTYNEDINKHIQYRFAVGLYKNNKIKTFVKKQPPKVLRNLLTIFFPSTHVEYIETDRDLRDAFTIFLNSTIYMIKQSKEIGIGID